MLYRKQIDKMLWKIEREMGHIFVQCRAEGPHEQSRS